MTIKNHSMLFKDLKPGHPVYMLEKGKEMKAFVGKAVHVGEPYFPQTPGSAYPNYQTGQRFVDVTVEAGGASTTYSIPETSSLTYSKDMVLSTDRDGILREVEAVKNQNEEELRKVEQRQSAVASCEKILEEWNPAFAEKKENEKRISGLESQVKGLGEKIEALLKKLE